MKFCLFLAILAGVVPAQAMATTYMMSFAGGPYEHGIQIDFAPESGSFTYDPVSGFSNFLVHYNGDVFDFTAAQELQWLSNHGLWVDQENTGNPFVSIGSSFLTLGGVPHEIQAEAPGFLGFSVSSPPAVGSFAITAVPEPQSLALLCAGAGVFLWGAVRRKAKETGGKRATAKNRVEAEESRQEWAS